MGSTGSEILCYCYVRDFGLEDGLWPIEDHTVGEEESQRKSELLFVVLVVFGTGIFAMAAKRSEGEGRLVVVRQKKKTIDESGVVV